MKTNNVSISNNEKLGLISNLSTMLKAGIPLLETVDSLLEDAKGGQKKLLEALREDLIQGKHMNYTFERFPKIFNKVSTNIIKASEEAGTLDVTLMDLKENLQRDIEFSDKVKSALIYPVFIIFVFFAVLLMILVVVVPKISTVFSRLNVELPLPTQIMIFMSDMLLTYTIPVIVGIVVFVGVMFFVYKRYKDFMLNVFMSLPLVNKLARDIDLTRFTRSLYLLLNAGLPITKALELSVETTHKKDVRKAIEECKNTVIGGKKLSDGFKKNKNVFPSIMIRISEAGERSGSLDKSLLEVSEFMDYQVSGRLKTLTALLEPILLVVIGGLIGGMMLAIIAPIYGLIGQINNR